MKGQALITLLFFLTIIITITAAAVVIILTGSSNATKFEQGTRVYYIAESGIENALIRLLRDPLYSGETMTVGDGSVTVTVTGSSPYVITSVGTIGNAQRTIRANAAFTTGILNVTDWKEI